MTPREFFSAWVGWGDGRREEWEVMRNLTYGAARWSASATAMSKEQAKALQSHRFPWERKQSSEGVSVHEKIGAFIQREERRINRDG